MQASRVAALTSLLLIGCSDSPTDPGEGTIAGTAVDLPFDAVAASYRIGAPDDPQRTVVVYLFDAPVDCADLGSPGWDQRVDGVQSLEIKTIGKTTGDYEVATGPTPGTGQASVNYTLTSPTAPAEVSALAGTVTLTAIGDDDAEGEFTLSFDGGTLTGSFRAAPCPEGHEP